MVKHAYEIWISGREQSRKVNRKHSLISLMMQDRTKKQQQKLTTAITGISSETAWISKLDM